MLAYVLWLAPFYCSWSKLGPQKDVLACHHGACRLPKHTCCSPTTDVPACGCSVLARFMLAAAAGWFPAATAPALAPLGASTLGPAPVSSASSCSWQDEVESRAALGRQLQMLNSCNCKGLDSKEVQLFCRRVAQACHGVDGTKSSFGNDIASHGVQDQLQATSFAAMPICAKVCAEAPAGLAVSHSCENCRLESSSRESEAEGPPHLCILLKALDQLETRVFVELELDPCRCIA